MNTKVAEYMRAELAALSMQNWAKLASADEVIEEIAKFASAEDLTDDQILYLLKTAGFADSLGSAFGAVKSLGSRAAQGLSSAGQSIGRVMQAPATRRLADAGKSIGSVAPLRTPQAASMVGGKAIPAPFATQAPSSKVQAGLQLNRAQINAQGPDKGFFFAPSGERVPTPAQAISMGAPARQPFKPNLAPVTYNTAPKPTLGSLPVPAGMKPRSPISNDLTGRSLGLQSGGAANVIPMRSPGRVVAPAQLQAAA